MATPKATLTLKKLLYRSIVVPGELVVAVTGESNGFAVWLFNKGDVPELKKWEFESSPAIDFAKDLADQQRLLHPATGTFVFAG